MKKAKSLYHGHRFPATVISQAVRWYFRFQLSLRDIVELFFERGVTVTYETIRCWCDKFGEGFAHRVKAAQRKPGSTWHLDEMFVTLRDEPYLLWRAFDKHDAELDILLQKRRDKAAAKRFFKSVMRLCPTPGKIVTDLLRSHRAAKAEIPELASVKHVFVEAAARLNNRAENSHQPTRERERRIPQGDFVRVSARPHTSLLAKPRTRQHHKQWRRQGAFAGYGRRMRAPRPQESPDGRWPTWVFKGTRIQRDRSAARSRPAIAITIADALRGSD
nr:IS6 family transposase [Paraburkholderia panacisoli]